MMIKQRIFRTNSLMVLFSLVILLLIGGSMISIFKDRFLGWYSDNSKISEKYVDAYQKIENMDFSARDWEQYAKAVQPYDFHLIVRDEGHGTYAASPLSGDVHHETFDVWKVHDLLST